MTIPTPTKETKMPDGTTPADVKKDAMNGKEKHEESPKTDAQEKSSH